MPFDLILMIVMLMNVYALCRVGVSVNRLSAAIERHTQDMRRMLSFDTKVPHGQEILN